MEATVGCKGELRVVVCRGSVAAKAWRRRNSLRPAYVWGWLANKLAALVTQLTGIPTITAELEAIVTRKNGSVERLGVVSRRVVTSAGVAFLVDDMDDSTTDITTLNYHECGTGVGAEDVGDTTLGTAIESREAGSKAQPAANQLRSTATISMTGTHAVTEHGLFSANSGGTLWDRSVFSAINVVSGDSIQFIYTVTFTAGS